MANVDKSISWEVFCIVARFEHFCTVISGIQRSIQRIERVEMAKYGLKGPHANCLVTIAMSRYPDGVTAAQLCEICDKDRAAISRTVSELEQAGMLMRHDPEGKRYRSRLRLSEKGKDIARNVSELVLLAVSRASEGYDKEHQQTFMSLIAGNLHAICTEGLKNTI